MLFYYLYETLVLDNTYLRVKVQLPTSDSIDIGLTAGGHTHTHTHTHTHLYVPTIHSGESALWGKCVRPSWSLWGTYTHTYR